MKKLMILLVSAAMVLSLVACGNSQSGNTNNTPADNKGPIVTSGNGGYEEKISMDVQTLISDLTKESENLIGSIQSYDDYVNKAADVEAFYEKILNKNKAFWLDLYKDSLAWITEIVSSNKEYKDKTDDMDDVYDATYDDAPEEIYYYIYEDVFENVYEAIYDGVLKDIPEGVDYADWLDVRTTEYRNWLESRSDMYEEWLDNRSELYEFIIEVQSDLADDDTSKVDKELSKFQKKIDKMK